MIYTFYYSIYIIILSEDISHQQLPWFLISGQYSAHRHLGRFRNEPDGHPHQAMEPYPPRRLRPRSGPKTRHSGAFEHGHRIRIQLLRRAIQL